MKTRPIVLPIDPKKTYLTKGSLIITRFEIGTDMRYGWAYPELPYARYGIDMTTGKSRYPHVESLDLVAEVVEDEQPKERDWSDVIDAILTKASSYYNAPDFSYKFKQLEADTIAILQEFDRQNPVDMSAKQDSCASVEDKNPKESSAVELPEFVIGEMYESIYHGDKEIGILVWLYDDRAVLFNKDVGIMGTPFTRDLASIRKHIPTPKEHTYSMEEIEEELSTWQEEPISPVHFCRRGKMIQQLVKEVYKDMVKI